MAWGLSAIYIPAFHSIFIVLKKNNKGLLAPIGAKK
jgi:hypothetical protein